MNRMFFYIVPAVVIVFVLLSFSLLFSKTMRDFKQGIHGSNDSRTIHHGDGQDDAHVGGAPRGKKNVRNIATGIGSNSCKGIFKIVGTRDGQKK